MSNETQRAILDQAISLLRNPNFQKEDLDVLDDLLYEAFQASMIKDVDLSESIALLRNCIFNLKGDVPLFEQRKVMIKVLKLEESVEVLESFGLDPIFHLLEKLL